VTTSVYVPRDSAALAVGAEAVAAAIAREAARRRADLRIVRNGSRGLFWLEPMVEVASPGGRVAFGPVHAEDVPGLFEADFLEGGRHPLSLGPTEDIPFLKRQDRRVFARVGIIDPLDLDDYVAMGGFQGLKRASALSQNEIVQEVERSGLRGRGGAAFPTGLKWKAALEAPGAQKYVVCNADEGDGGTFADRLLLEGDPFLVIEGMIIAGLAVGASRGYIYVRAEYPRAAEILAQAVARAEMKKVLGNEISGIGKPFHIEVRRGAGAYVCGEETALLESLEGRRGMVRAKPPVPAIAGLFGMPTVVNNVLTLASVPMIFSHGADFQAACGAGRSRGTAAYQLAGNVKHGGLVEKAFGLSLRELVEDFGGGTESGRPIGAVQMGGPLGSYLPPSKLGVSLRDEALASVGGMLGHGGVVVFDDAVDMARQARAAMAFCALESCGKCAPCRIGSIRGVEILDDLLARREPPRQLELLRDLCETMARASLCALGARTPAAVLSAIDGFPGAFQTREDRLGGAP
jgi:formate dehydrogenase iron-sulfur subunit